MRAPWLPLAVLLLAAGSLSADDAHVIETAHYRVHVHGTRAQAEEAARVLEAAWTPFETHFGAAPKLAKDERLTVRLVEGREAFEAAIRADGTEPPGAGGGYYWPGSKTAYLFRQPTVYYTRTLLIHEAAHQFHYLARTRNKNPKANWYTEGVAEYLSWHRWDRSELELAVVPGITLKAYPATALKEATAKDFKLGHVVEGSKGASRAIAWALYRYLATGRKGEPLKGFATFTRKMDAGGSARALFGKLIGSPRTLQARLIAWLQTQQSPWVPVFNEWEQTGAESFRGFAEAVSACRTRAPATFVAAEMHVPEAGWWRGGLLLQYASADDYTVALLDADGGVRVHRRHEGTWKPIHDGSVERTPGARWHRFEAERKANAVVLRIDGYDFGTYELPAGPMGLALERCDLRFDPVTIR